MDSLLTVRDLSLTLGGKPVLKNLSFDLKVGELVILLGPSGSGKSSLLRCLNRLQTIDAGEIRLNGESVLGMKIIELRRQLGLVFQLSALIPESVRENVCLGPNLRHQELTEIQCESLIAEVGLPKYFLDRNVETLSVGERQRVALAQVLANRPEVLLLDEPTSALDPTAARTVEKLIETLHEVHNIGILMVTHDVSQAMRFDAETLVLIDGGIRARGNIRRLKESTEDETLRKFFAGRLQPAAPKPEGDKNDGE